MFNQPIVAYDHIIRTIGWSFEPICSKFRDLLDHRCLCDFPTIFAPPTSQHNRSVPFGTNYNLNSNMIKHIVLLCEALNHNYFRITFTKGSQSTLCKTNGQSIWILDGNIWTDLNAYPIVYQHVFEAFHYGIDKDNLP